ncbi:choline transporter-like protein 1 [Littorina saxatilis]|uniref:Choline transporter-like protein n=1 Tax=Littorina saxatilis TaxID=31220 RepID=A0AAN9BBW7_9CAEN
MGCCGGNNAVVQPIKGDRSVEQKFDGPTKHRVCRDVIVLLLFIAFLGGLGWLFYYTIGKGNPNVLIYGTDSYGNVCNQENDVIPGAIKSGRDTSGLKYLFYFDSDYLEKIMNAHTNKMDSVAVCVKLCPNETLRDVSGFQAFYDRYGSSVCNYDVPKNNYDTDGTTCPDTTIGKSVEPQVILFNRCIPKTLSTTLDRFGDFLNSILELVDDDFGQKCVNDLENTWQEIMYLCLIGFGISLVMLVLLRFFVGVMVWTVVFLVAVGSLAGTGFCWYSWYIERTTAWLGGAIAASVVTLIILLILIVMWKRFKLVVQLFKEAGKAVAKMPLLLLQPIMALILLGGALAGFGYMFLYVVTTRNPVVNGTSTFVSYEQDELMKGMFFYYLLGFLWVTQFIMACERLTVSSAVALWYFTRDKTRLGMPIGKSIYRLIRFHLGSVAFGSLLIAFVILIRWILSFIEGRLKGSENFLAKFVLKCMICCLWCFEKILKFINSNAYIEIAIHGYGFCKAARTAFMVIVKNALRVAAINSVGDFILFLAKAGTVAVVAVVGIEFFRDKADVNYVWLPITLACVFAYFIASCFLGVYEMTIDAIFICFVEDCEMNDGVSRPYFMSMGLMEYVNNSDDAKKVANLRRQKREEF